MLSKVAWFFAANLLLRSFWSLGCGVVASSAQGAASALLLLIGSWVTAQNAIGRVLRQSGTFKVDWSSTEELCIGLHPKDVALNHSEVIRAMSAYNQRRPNQGKAILDAHLDAHPRCISGLRVQRKAAGLPTDPASMCTAVDAVLEGTR